MASKRDYTGKKFNHLTALRYSRSGGKGVGAYWLTQCDCGNQIEVLAKYLVSGRNKTCGECQYTRDLMRRKKVSIGKENYSIRTQFQKQVRASIFKRRDWTLTIEEFKGYISGQCFCCGDDSSAAKVTVGRVLTEGHFTSQNVIPICRTCSKWQGEHNLADFLEHVVTIARNLSPPAK